MKEEKIKVIAFYLPQFHEIPENNKWWGKGFTEWVNVKKATPIFENHNQPRIPMNNNYYDLNNVDVMKWQAKIAKENGIYGFCFYHYWFDGKLLLEKPVENYLKEKDIDFPFCISWANEHWTNQWVSSQNSILIEQKYGEEKDWISHFEYLLPFFKDKRYIKKDGKPIIIIYRPELIDCLKEMIDCWQKLAKKNGLNGLCIISQRVDIVLNNPKADVSMIDNFIEYQPGTVFVTRRRKNKLVNYIKQHKRRFDYFLEKKLPKLSSSKLLNKNKSLTIYNYDEIWEDILKQKPVAKNSIPCAFVDWDNTPRKHEKGSVVFGANPKSFEKYFSRLISKTIKEYNQDMMFIFAWNEWAEGGYLEPDEKNKYGYLESIKKCIKK